MKWDMKNEFKSKSIVLNNMNLNPFLFVHVGIVFLTLDSLGYKESLGSLWLFCMGCKQIPFFISIDEPAH